jgi:hypothetical protein
VTKSFAAFTCVVALTLLAATGAQGCGNPGDALLADPVVTKSETTAQQATPKNERTTEQGDK